VGGLTEQHRIGQYADDHGIMNGCRTAGNTGIGLAADLHLMATAGNARWVEFSVLLRPYMDDVFETPLKTRRRRLSRDS